MANKVEIRVTVNGDAVPAELAGIEAATKNSTDKQSSAWSTLGQKVGGVFGGLGVVASGALGVGLVGPLAAAGLAMGAFGAVAAPTLKKVETALTTTGKAGTKAWAALDPAQRNLATSVKGLESSFDGLEKKLEPTVTSILNMATHTAGDLLPAIGQLAPAGAKVIADFLTPFNKLLTSPFFAQFIKQMNQLATQVGPVLGQTLVGLLKVFMQLFMQAGPDAVKVLNQLLPAILDIVSGLIPFIAAVTHGTAVTLDWLAKNHLLIPALAAVGAALVAVGLAMDATPIGALITGIVLLIGAFTHLWQTSQTFRMIVLTVFKDVGDVVLTFAQVWLHVNQQITNVFLSSVGIIIDGAAKAFGWIPGVGPKLKEAAKAFDGFRSDVNNVFNKAEQDVAGWKQTLDNAPKKMRLEGDITDLTAKLNNAESQLRNPDLTKTRRAALQADISQLQAQIAKARADLAAINGTTATTYIVTVKGGQKAFAHGGIVGAAGGGPRSNLTLVGEAGPELVSLPAGSTVHSNPDSQRMIAQAGGGNGLVQLEVLPGGASAFEQFMIEALRNWVRIKGGGNVQAAFGRA